MTLTDASVTQSNDLGTSYQLCRYTKTNETVPRNDETLLYMTPPFIKSASTLHESARLSSRCVHHTCFSFDPLKIANGYMSIDYTEVRYE